MTQEQKTDKQKIEDLITTMTTITTKEDQLTALNVAVQTLRDGKPEGRSETARRYAVTITELEKVIAYFKVYVMYASQD